MKQAAKLADVARAAGVSQGTASNVFNRPEIVRPEVRARVEASARRLGYCGPDPKGRILRAGKVNAIGIVTADDMAYSFRDPYMRLVMAGIAEECEAHGAGLALVSAMRREEAAWRIQTAVVDGFIVNCLRAADGLIALARRRNLPFVAIGVDAGPGTSSVLVEDRRGATLATRHLLDLGHRRIGILAIDETGPGTRGGWADVERLRSIEHRFVRERVEGYSEALREKGIALEALPVMELPNEREEAARRASDLLVSRPETTAILAMSDVLALGAIDAARSRGLRVPEDLSVVGFDDVPLAARACPPLTTVRQPIEQMGASAVNTLLAVLAGLEPASEVITFATELVVRGSAVPPRGRRSQRHAA
jgi:DNA-binding LacI/PurR family transcriptional regulator